MTLEAKWYKVRALPPLKEQEPPPSDHPQYERIMAIQAQARAKQIAALKPQVYEMWGPQIAFIFGAEPYEVLGPVE